MDAEQVIQILMMVMGVSGPVGTFYMMMKVRPEVGLMMVDAANKVVEFQTATIIRLEGENRTLRERVEFQQKEIDTLTARIRHLERTVEDAP